VLRLRRIDPKRSSEVAERLREYVEEVVKVLNPRLIVLFGSFARGDVNEGSDIDLIVVADFQEEFLDRITLLMKMNRFRLPIEPIGYTPVEFEDMRTRRNTFIEEALQTGRILYGALDCLWQNWNLRQTDLH